MVATNLVLINSGGLKNYGGTATNIIAILSRGLKNRPIFPQLFPQRVKQLISTKSENPFLELVVRNNPLGGTLVSWGLQRDFNDPLPYRFTLYWAETPNGDYEEIPTQELLNTYSATDYTRRLWSKDTESYYKVVMETTEGTYVSPAVNANAYWAKRDWLIAREICRKEMLLFRKHAGWKGWLLKAKVYGPACTRCGDYDLEGAADAHCPVCYGTGKQGGYWAPFATYTYNMQSGPQARKSVNESTGLAEPLVLPGMRWPGYPQLATNDVFVHEGSGNRYYIRKTAVLADIKSIPVIYGTELVQAPYTDIIYTVPLTGEPDVVPPSSENTGNTEDTLQETASIYWNLGEWHLEGSDGEFSYATNKALPDAGSLHEYTWDVTLGMERTEDGFTVASSPAAGDYIAAGIYNGLVRFARYN